MVYPPARHTLALAPARGVLAGVCVVLSGLGIVALGGCGAVWVKGGAGLSDEQRQQTDSSARASERGVAAAHDPWDLRLSRPPVGGPSVQPVQLAASRPFLTRSGSWYGAGGRSRRSLRPAGTSVRTLVARHARGLAPCFAGAHGVVHLELLIRPSGRVGRIWTPGTAPTSVRRCVRQRARRWTFGPLPQIVRHRLTLRALGEAQ